MHIVRQHHLAATELLGGVLADLFMRADHQFCPAGLRGDLSIAGAFKRTDMVKGLGYGSTTNQ